MSVTFNRLMAHCQMNVWNAGVSDAKSSRLSDAWYLWATTNVTGNIAKKDEGKESHAGIHRFKNSAQYQ